MLATSLKTCWFTTGWPEYVGMTARSRLRRGHATANVPRCQAPFRGSATPASARSATPFGPTSRPVRSSERASASTPTAARSSTSGADGPTPRPHRPWDRDTIACVFSSTKGLAAIALLMLVERGAVDLDAPVARYWPEFAAAGKDELPVRYLLTHEAGLSAIGKPLPFGSLSDWDVMVDALAEQEPWWEPGTGHGYHGVTFGHLVGEVAAPRRRPHARRLPPRRAGGPRSASTSTWGCPESEEAAHRRHGQRPDGPLAPDVLLALEARRLGPKSFGNPPDCNLVEHTNSRAVPRAPRSPPPTGTRTRARWQRLRRARQRRNASTASRS